MNEDRRRFLRDSTAYAATLRGIAGSPAALFFAESVRADTEAGFVRQAFGDGELLLLSDGNLQLPRSFLFPESIDPDELDAFLESHGMGGEFLEPPCNVTLLRSGDRTVLFDVGAGSGFMPSAGKLSGSLEAAGIEPSDVTDVVFTHAHPDHLWGVLDDFDDLLFAEATYYMNVLEWDFWSDPETVDEMPDARKAFAAGALNRLPVIEERIVLFGWGDEVLPGVEAVDTHGHTPGHTSFALHEGSESLLLLGDAITNAAVSFAHPEWPSGSDQDQEQGIRTRQLVLDRLVADSMTCIGFHFPVPGIGRVERDGSAYRYLVA